MSTTTTYSTISLDEAAREAAKDGRAFVRLRRKLGITSFGVNALYQAAAGERVVGEHHELNPGAGGHEELYAVVSGGARFTIDGDDVDVPLGSVVVIAPQSTRSAVATEPETLVLVVGGRPGEYAMGAGEALAPMFEHYNEQDYAGALEKAKAAFETHPGNALVFYNVACMASLLGHADEALAALEESVTKWPAYKELAAGDDDFASLREDERFQALIA